MRYRMIDVLQCTKSLCSSFTHLTNKIADVQIPVQVYNGKNGTFIFSANFTRVATNANTGPVLPIIVNGWALVNA